MMGGAGSTLAKVFSGLEEELLREVSLGKRSLWRESKEPRSKLRGIKRQNLTNLGGVDPHVAA